MGGIHVNGVVFGPGRVDMRRPNRVSIGRSSGIKSSGDGRGRP